MVIEEMYSYIVCSECGYGFKFSAYSREKLETIYDNMFKMHISKCAHCNKGVLAIREAKFKMNKAKNKEYVLTWQCLNCKALWTQHDNYVADENASIGRGLEELKSETSCPICHIKDARVLSMHGA